MATNCIRNEVITPEMALVAMNVDLSTIYSCLGSDEIVEMSSSILARKLVYCSYFIRPC